MSGHVQAVGHVPAGFASSVDFGFRAWFDLPACETLPVLKAPCVTLRDMHAHPSARAPVEPERINGARIVTPAPGATKWGWLIDVASDWSVPVLVVPWNGATEDTCRGIRGVLNGSRSTGWFRWSVRTRGDSVVIARFGLRPSLLRANDSERSESHARFASLKGLGWQNPTGPRRRGMFRL